MPAPPVPPTRTPPDASPPTDSPTLVEQWNAARQLIEHRNATINQRLTLAASIEGFVFLLFVNFGKALVEVKTNRWEVFLGCVLLCVIGAAIPWFFMPELRRHHAFLLYAYDFLDLTHGVMPQFSKGVKGRWEDDADNRGWWWAKPNLWTLPWFATLTWVMAGLVVSMIYLNPPPVSPVS